MRRVRIFAASFIGWMVGLGFLVAGSQSVRATHCEPCDGINGTIALTCAWQTLQGSIESVADEQIDDAFNFVAIGGTTYVFSFCQNGGTADFDTALSINDETCSLDFPGLACDDDSCGLQAELSWTAPASGTYTVRISPFFEETGSYTLAYRRVCCVCGSDVDDNPVCFVDVPCNETTELCSTDDPCPTGQACIESNCCTAAALGCYDICGDGCDNPGMCDGGFPECGPTGACCGPGCACRITTEADCIHIGGTYNGDDTACDPSPQLSPEIGEIILNECYDTIGEAQADAEMALMAATTDGCPNNLDFQVVPMQSGCTATFDMSVADNCENTVNVMPSPTATIDPTPPTATCVLPNGPVVLSVTECEAEIQFAAMITDNCCVDIESVDVSNSVVSGKATIEFNQADDCEISFPNGSDKVSVSCTLEVSNITECPFVVEVNVTAMDCCGHPLAETCRDTVEVRDNTPPMITNCPEPITLPRGDHLCDTAVQDWLDTFTATDNCPAARVYDADDLDLTIPDDGISNVMHTINVAESFNIEDVNIDLAIDHSRMSELRITVSHGGIIVTLTDQFGGCDADNYTDIIIDDEGALLLEDQCEDDLSSPPNYIPQIPLSTFDGMNAMGDWKITIFDRTNGNTGTLDEWSLHFNGGPILSNDAPDCGFPPGTTDVTFTATDTCGNTASCASEITIEPFDRVDISDKGSFLAFSKIEIQWEDQTDGSQLLLKDTFLDISNDYPAGVWVQAYFINGDITQEEIRDDDGEIIQAFEPGWNTADCLFQLTANQPHFWSAANGSDKCQPFVVLDEDGPGRINPETNNPCRVLRGYAVFYAVKLKTPTVAGAGAPEFEEIRWNHLKGDAVIVDYSKGTAEEYNAWSAAVVDCVAHGEPPRDCICRDENGTCCEAEVRSGRLDFDGFQYAIGFDELLLDFYGSGSTVFSGGGLTVMLDTQLTLHTLGADLRQDGGGPILTKVEAEIWNEFESKFSGTRRCLCCWDSTFLSDWARSEAIPNHFTRTALRTDKGKARLDGVESDECDYFEICGREPRILIEIVPLCEIVAPPVVAGFPNGLSFSRDASLLGIATKMLSFSGQPTEENAASAINLVGLGTESARIRTDAEEEIEEQRGNSDRTIRAPSGDETGRGAKGSGGNR